MDIELISIEADLLHTEESDLQTTYIMDMCEQLGCRVVCSMKMFRQNNYLTDMVKVALDRSHMVMILCASKVDIDVYSKKIASEVFHREDGILTEQDKSVVFLPCDEKELHSLMRHEVRHLLIDEQKQVVYSATVKMCGVSEAEVEEAMLLLKGNNPIVKMVMSSRNGEICVRMTAKANDDHTAKKALKPVIKEFLDKFGDHVYSTDDNVSLEASVIQLLKERELTLTTAESLTGGLLAAKFTNVPGASEVFKQGLVTYCNRAKRKLLDVKKSTLKEYGAVSDRTAKEMAKNGAFATGADVCVSLTGLAGPAAEEGKPVGLVYIACCYKNRTVVNEFHFEGSRRQIREQAANHALMLLRECILSDY